MKTCMRCNFSKELDEFYKHKGMTDGHLNICKVCKRLESKIWGSSPNGRISDKKRGQTKKRKEWSGTYQKASRIKNAKKYKARTTFWSTFRKGTIKKLPCEECGTEEFVQAHHPDYNYPLKVMWLCIKHHKAWHRENEVIT